MPSDANFQFYEVVLLNIFNYVLVPLEVKWTCIRKSNLSEKNVGLLNVLKQIHVKGKLYPPLNTSNPMCRYTTMTSFGKNIPLLLLLGSFC